MICKTIWRYLWGTGFKGCGENSLIVTVLWFNFQIVVWMMVFHFTLPLLP